MILVDQIKEMLMRLSHNQISLEEFEDWFMPAALHMHSDSPDDAVALASLIHAIFSERDNASLNAHDVRVELSSLVSVDAVIKISGPAIALPQHEVVSSSASASETVTVFVNMQRARGPNHRTTRAASAPRHLDWPVPA